jgi:hypothetical protein
MNGGGRKNRRLRHHAPDSPVTKYPPREKSLSHVDGQHGITPSAASRHATGSRLPGRRGQGDFSVSLGRGTRYGPPGVCSEDA